MNTVPRIVVGVDGFESSKAALRWAIHQAKLTGAVVDAVTTWHFPPGSGLVPAADMPDYQDDARIILTEAITEMCTVDTDVVVRPRVVEGQAGPVLVDAAEGADLLVVGNRGHGGLAEALLGSVGQYCVRHAPCPRRHHARQAGRARLVAGACPRSAARPSGGIVVHAVSGGAARRRSPGLR
jgi:nucleotide-binding universal stress UspA family protein